MEKYKGSPFLNIGPQVQEVHFDKPINPNYKGPKPPSQQAQKHPLNLTDKSPFRITDGFKWYTSLPQVPYISNEGYRYIISNYMDAKNVEIQFIDYFWKTTTDLNSAKTGTIKFPYNPIHYNKCFGEGEFGCLKSELKIYKAWRDMFERVKDPRYREKNLTYENVDIHYDWYNYQNFAKWMNEYLGTLNQDLYEDYRLEKDILQWGIEPKIYGPYTCCIVPSIINMTISGYADKDAYFGVRKTRTGSYMTNIHKVDQRIYLGTYKTQEEAFLVYKKEKEKYIKELADYYYSINAIHKDIHDILYRIDIQPDGKEKLR